MAGGSGFWPRARAPPTAPRRPSCRWWMVSPRSRRGFKPWRMIGGWGFWRRARRRSPGPRRSRSSATRRRSCGARWGWRCGRCRSACRRWRSSSSAGLLRRRRRRRRPRGCAATASRASPETTSRSRPPRRRRRPPRRRAARWAGRRGRRTGPPGPGGTCRGRPRPSRRRAHGRELLVLFVWLDVCLFARGGLSPHVACAQLPTDMSVLSQPLLATTNAA